MSAVNPIASLPLFASSVYSHTTKKPMKRWKAGPALSAAENAIQHGRDGAEDALQGIGGGIPDGVRQEMRRVIRAEPAEFTTDLLRARFSQSVNEVLNHPHHQNALAGLLTTMAKAGEIRFTGSYVKSVRPSARGRMLKVWRTAP